MGTTDKLFLSHATPDRAVADLLRDTLVLAGLPEGRIFYSAGRSTGVPSGTDVRARLRQELQQAGLVLELVSTSFLSRPMCWVELGGAWALELSTYPIVVPPAERDDVRQQIGDVQMGTLKTPADIDDVFDELHDRLRSELAFDASASGWNRAVRSFRERVVPLLVAPDHPRSTPLTSSAASSSRAARPERSPSGLSIAKTGVSGSGMSEVIHGEVTNSDGRARSAVLRATLYGQDGKIAGTFDGLVLNLEAGDTETFAINTYGNSPPYESLQVKAINVH